jgi:hypothetical protein
MPLNCGTRFATPQNGKNSTAPSLLGLFFLTQWRKLPMELIETLAKELGVKEEQAKEGESVSFSNLSKKIYRGVNPK